MYVNTAKEGFMIEVAKDFEELGEPESTVMEMTTRGFDIIGIKTISCYYTCSSWGKTAVCSNVSLVK